MRLQTIPTAYPVGKVKYEKTKYEKTVAACLHSSLGIMAVMKYECTSHLVSVHQYFSQ